MIDQPKEPIKINHVRVKIQAGQVPHYLLSFHFVHRGYMNVSVERYRSEFMEWGSILNENQKIKDMNMASVYKLMQKLTSKIFRKKLRNSLISSGILK